MYLLQVRTNQQSEKLVVSVCLFKIETTDSLSPIKKTRGKKTRRHGFTLLKAHKYFSTALGEDSYRVTGVRAGILPNISQYSPGYHLTLLLNRLRVSISLQVGIGLCLLVKVGSGLRFLVIA